MQEYKAARCPICDNNFSMITSTHLKKHSLSMKEFKKMYPNCKIVSSKMKTHLLSIANNGKGWLNPEKAEIAREKLSEAQKGVPESIQTREKMKAGQALFWASERSEKLREQRSQRLKKFRLSDNWIEYINSDKRKRDCRKGAIKTHETLKLKKFHNTKLELKMIDILNILKMKFFHPYTIWNIEHCYSCDFYLPKYSLIIEVDGKYWHNYPFGTDLDNIRKVELINAGYKVLRFWEDELTEDIVKQKILSVI